MTKAYLISYVLWFQLVADRKVYPVTKQMIPFFFPGTSSSSPCTGGRENDNFLSKVIQLSSDMSCSLGIKRARRQYMHMILITIIS